MANEPRAPRLAVLIDAENISANLAKQLFEHAQTLGQVTIRRAYGDFSGERLKAWVGVFAKHAIEPRQVFHSPNGKNCADIALIIDAMDLLYSGEISGLYIGSSDSDFTALAVRARQMGLTVYGFGKADTAQTFRQACMRFVAVAPALTVPPAQPKPATPTVPKQAAAQPKSATPEFVPLIRQVFDEMDKVDGWVDGWVALSALGSKLRQAQQDFKPKDFGAASLSKLLAKSNLFQVDTNTAAGGRVRLAEGKPTEVKTA